MTPTNAEQPGNAFPKRRIGRQEEIMFIPLLLFFRSPISCASVVQAIMLFRADSLYLDIHLDINYRIDNKAWEERSEQKKYEIKKSAI